MDVKQFLDTVDYRGFKEMVAVWIIVLFTF